MKQPLFGWFMYLAMGAWIVYLIPTVLAAIGQFDPPFLLQTTDSAPRGMYRLSSLPDPVTRGTLVTLPIPSSIAELVFDHGWLPRTWNGLTPVLVKPVAGLAGDVFCVRETGVSLNGLWLGPVYRELGGVTLPVLRGCWVLEPEQVLLLNPDVSNALDGRYFGLVSRQVLQHQAVLWWTWE